MSISAHRVEIPNGDGDQLITASRTNRSIAD